MIVSVRQDGLYISEVVDLQAQQSQEFAQNCVKNKKHPVSSSSAGKNALEMKEVSGE